MLNADAQLGDSQIIDAKKDALEEEQQQWFPFHVVFSCTFDFNIIYKCFGGAVT